MDLCAFVDLTRTIQVYRCYIQTGNATDVIYIGCLAEANLLFVI